ncbi:glycine N-acyltransferase-like protein 3 [Frieseomelitta varia]|uniref:glycine N-acyltransferase-like protein 3 n=1 Tax=Frieseomelitta varia TaxID=561572 RepID=UPI001CB6AAE0|nr:glycine N-acyltransferase-like protein 3 [Frieseomelitta varia]
MSKNSITDILQPVPFEKWSLIQNKTKLNWPEFAYYYYWIQNSIVWKKENPNISIQIYCPDGDYEQGTFIGISNFSVCNILIFTLHPNSDIIHKVLTETKLIDYDQQICFASVHGSFASNVFTALETLKYLRNVETELVLSNNYYFKPTEECIKTKIWIPDECYIKPLDKLNVPLIHSLWPHKSVKNPELSLKYIATLIELNGGIGLYLKKNDSLVSWGIQNDWQGLGMVQTLEEHKGKGYAKVIVNMLSKKIAEQGISTTLFIIKGNTSSEKMFKALGWKAVASCEFIKLTTKKQ